MIKFHDFVIDIQMYMDGGKDEEEIQMDKSMRHDIALFRYRMIAPLVNGHLDLPSVLPIRSSLALFPCLDPTATLGNTGRIPASTRFGLLLLWFISSVATEKIALIHYRNLVLLSPLKEWEEAQYGIIFLTIGMRQACSVRLYPTKEQEPYIRSIIGCCRFVYNHFLTRWTEGRLEGICLCARMVHVERIVPPVLER
ncbi:Transposase, IS605 OrfB [Geobacillus thermoleovorans CCB_US3_UF5]|nr:Transposase, IS605 OrfB [Geobacillus thermoleovorans CCB_US3_UF5]QDY71938.1 transposase [Geobacillus thermoleovorans]RXS84626.1 transposase [Geobacillus sp. PK12]